MKIKLEGKTVQVLKGAENYRQWKQEVQMAAMALGVSVLLYPYKDKPIITPPPNTTAPPTSSSTTSSSTPPNMDATNVSARRDEDDDITLEKWQKLNEQFVSQLFFYVSPIYKPLLFNLPVKTLPALFALLDAQFVNSDTMIRVAKRGELDAFKFKIDKSFLEQIIKYEEIITQLAELGSIISDEDKCYGLIKALLLQRKAQQLYDNSNSQP